MKQTTSPDVARPVNGSVSDAAGIGVDAARTEPLLRGLFGGAELLTDLSPAHAVASLSVDGEICEIVQFEMKSVHPEHEPVGLGGVQLLEVRPDRMDCCFNDLVGVGLAAHRQCCIDARVRLWNTETSLSQGAL